MATILEKLAAHAAERVAEKKKRVCPEEMRERAFARYREEASGAAFAFERALSGEGIHVICE